MQRASLIVLVSIAGWIQLAAQDVRLEVGQHTGEPWIRLSSEAPANLVQQVESSSNLANWAELARVHGGLVAFPDLRAPTDQVFYRSVLRSRTAQDDWKNQAHFVGDPFLSSEPSYWDPEIRWIKFLIPADEPDRVYFQDSAKHVFHYDFAVARLPQFQGMTRATFDAVTLRAANQRAVLGALVFPPTTNLVEVGIQFAGQDSFSREQIAAWFRTVRHRVVTPLAAEVFYLPAYEQAEVARANVGWFEAQGISVRSADRWVLADESYSPGWALGRLVFVAATDIESAYRTGQLRPTDILLTDAVPAEVPPLAGIITLSPATPNSHVAILSKSFGIPFVYPADSDVRTQLLSWLGRDVILRAVENYGGNDIVVVPIEGALDAGLRAEILSLKKPPLLTIPAKASAGKLSLAGDGLRPADIRFVGGKAANFGLLRRSIPANSPSPAIAFTFDLWDAYLGQSLAPGLSLRGAIQQRLTGFSWPPDMAALKTALAEVRDLITDVADFSPEQQAAILDTVLNAGFDLSRNIRFRSSTNVEDSEQFTGAGLYDSYSGCLMDDLDGDDLGPSQCDLTEARERGVFRALRKVYASFYNDNAFLERLRYGVDENQVGMGVLVHHSTPDPEEMANGVATLTIRTFSQRYVEASFVTQAGAVSVANPDTTARAETVQVSAYGSFWPPSLDLTVRSSLVPLGGTVLDWPGEYHELFRLLDLAAKAYEVEFPAKQDLVLDLEYKRVTPGVLRVKQIRELPAAPVSGVVPAYFLNSQTPLTVFQGEYGDIIANHRLKSEWLLQARHTRLAPQNLGTSLFQHVRMTGITETNLTRWEGSISDLPAYRFAQTPEGTEERWTMNDSRRMTLRTAASFTRSVREGPLALWTDLWLDLQVDYPTPQPTLYYEPRFTNTLSESVRLVARTAPTAESQLQHRAFTNGVVSVETRFYWPRPPTGIVAGYTAPLQAWVETTIRGLTTQPIVLRDDFAQTYRPGHHNFYEEFAFEPRLDPEVPAESLVELAAQNCKALIVGGGMDGPTEMIIWGLDGKFRRL